LTVTMAVFLGFLPRARYSLRRCAILEVATIQEQ
jgi:hypothetical protein